MKHLWCRSISTRGDDSRGPGGEIISGNQFLITRALHFAHPAKRIIKQASLSHWVAEFNLKVSSVGRPSVVVQNGEPE